jgi:hypothetical protein
VRIAIKDLRPDAMDADRSIAEQLGLTAIATKNHCDLP